MADKAPQATAIGTDDDPTRGMPYHDKLTADLKALMARKRIIDNNVKNLDEKIARKETEYLESTPMGNILIGFDNYVKGTSDATKASSRRRGGISDNDRLFTKSGLRNQLEGLDSPGLSSALSTPSHPTPVATAGARGDVSAVATPSSATSASHKAGAGQKKGNKRVGSMVQDDSESEAKDSKKSRMYFSGNRK